MVETFDPLMTFMRLLTNSAELGRGLVLSSVLACQLLFHQL